MTSVRSIQSLASLIWAIENLEVVVAHLRSIHSWCCDHLCFLLVSAKVTTHGPFEAPVSMWSLRVIRRKGSETSSVDLIEEGLCPKASASVSASASGPDWWGANASVWGHQCPVWGRTQCRRTTPWAHDPMMAMRKFMRCPSLGLQVVLPEDYFASLLNSEFRGYLESLIFSQRSTEKLVQFNDEFNGDGIAPGVDQGDRKPQSCCISSRAVAFVSVLCSALWNCHIEMAQEAPTNKWLQVVCLNDQLNLINSWCCNPGSSKPFFRVGNHRNSCFSQCLIWLLQFSFAV